jgi:flagellar basal-body rod modification protein FlgD
MGVSAVDYVSQQLTSAAKKKEDAMGRDEFLKLFTTQLRAQNPLNPMNSTEFTAQLAQFSSLEQLTNINEGLKKLTLYQGSLQNTLATGMIGKGVKALGDEVSLKGTGEVSYSLGQDAAAVTVSIYDSSGRLVRKISNAAQKAGTNTVTWDGRDTAGVTQPDGKYKVKVEAADGSGAPVQAATLRSGTVTGVTFSDNTAYLVIDGTTRIQLGEVKEITGGGA